MRWSGTRSVRPGGRQVLAAAFLVGVLGLAACSGGDGDDVPVTTSTSSQSSSPTPGPSSSSAGASGQTPVGAKWDWARFDSYRTYLKNLEGGPSFFELTWCGVEPSQGVLNWNAVDRAVKGMDEIGMTPMLKIRTGMCWATEGTAQYQRGKADKTESGFPKSVTAYQTFVKAVVARYSGMGVHEYALENEVNAPSFWGGTPDQLQQLVKAGSSAIRAADSSAKVVDFGLASTTYGYGIAEDLLKAGKAQEAVTAYNTYFERRIGTRGAALPEVTTAAQLQDVLDSDQGKRNLTYLAMATALAQQHIVDIRQIHFYEKWSSVPMLMTYLKSHTPAGTPIEAWEVGSFWKSGDGTEAERSDEATRTMAGLLGAGVTKAIWLPLTVDPTGRNSEEPRYGLLDPSGTVRQSGDALAGMAAAARDAMAVPVSSDGLSGVGFERQGTSTLYVWGSKDLSLPAAAQVSTPGAQPTDAAAGSSVATADSVQVITVHDSVADFLKGL